MPRENTITKGYFQMSKPCRMCSFENKLKNPNVINTPVTFVFQTETKWPIWLV